MNETRTMRERFKVVPLEFPVTVDGRLWDKVTVRRMTVGEARRWIDAVLVSRETGALVENPMITDEAGQMVPAAVLDEFDADDFRVIDETVTDFMPRQLREATAPPSTAGADTSQS